MLRPLRGRKCLQRGGDPGGVSAAASRGGRYQIRRLRVSGEDEFLGNRRLHQEGGRNSRGFRKDVGSRLRQEIDFTPLGTKFRAADFSDASFLGCRFPNARQMAQELRAENVVLENKDSLPFKPFRAFLYTQRELADMDSKAYEYYKAAGSAPMAHLYFSAHDFSIRDALLDFVEGKTFVSIMGGHAVKRAEEAYRRSASLGRKLAAAGFIVSTGGGPGQMEAANLGAAYFDLPEADFNKALDLMAVPSSIQPEYLDRETPKRVIDKFPLESAAPSLGIPTFYYGHEPSNLFATFHAKFFSNAPREEVLLAICHGGLIMSPGGPGTFQELWQAGCQIAYAPRERKFPVVFLGKDFWIDSGVYDCFMKQATKFKHDDLVLITDSLDETVEFLVCVARERKLYLLQRPREEMMAPYWYSKD